MDPWDVRRVAPILYAAINFVVIVAPAFAITVAAERGGMGGVGDGRDLLAGSTVLATLHSLVAWRRLTDEERVAENRVDVWISAVNALVVLALAMPLLAVAILIRFADEHASLADRSYPVVVLWVGIQLIAVALAEMTGRVMFWWLEPGRRRSGTSITRRLGGRVLNRRRTGPPARSPSPPPDP